VPNAMGKVRPQWTEAPARLPPTADLAELLEQILDAMREVLEIERAAIHLHDAAIGTLKVAAHLGLEATFVERLETVGVGASVERAALVDRTSIVVEDVITESELGASREVYVTYGIRSLEAEPLVGSDGRVLGLLSIYRAWPRRRAERERKLLHLFMHQVEQVIESKQAEDALRRSEAGLRLALDAGEMGSWEWNIRTGDIRWSENLERIHGLPPGSFAGTFDAYQTLIHPDDRAGVLDAIRRSVDNHADYEVEFRSAQSAGGVRWMQGKGKVLTDEQGVPSRMIGVCMDVTKRKRAEEAILEADRRKDEFLAMISHELRNPLSAILNASELLGRRTGVPDAASSKTLTVIRRQTEQLTRIVDDLLDISRLNAGKLTLERTALDLAGLVDRCIKELGGRRLFEQHRLELGLESAPVNGDAARLEQVVTNLLTNALKYTPAGGTIAVKVETEGGEAFLSVKDTGVGIAPELLPRIFDLFVQSARALDRRDGGLGVGLSIVRRLVEAHGGRADATSDGPNRGAEFVVRLPLVATSNARGTLAGHEIGKPARRCILVVDDNDDAREGLVALLKLAGHDVHEAEDGPSGLERASRLRPDAVLVDIGLPGFDGFELARRLRAEGAAPHLIALTGYGHPDHRRLGAEAGFDAYLVKPVKIEAVLQTLTSGG
jgi:PAS domain S-box-containing protein